MKSVRECLCSIGVHEPGNECYSYSKDEAGGLVPSVLYCGGAEDFVITVGKRRIGAVRSVLNHFSNILSLGADGANTLDITPLLRACSGLEWEPLGDQHNEAPPTGKGRKRQKTLKRADPRSQMVKNANCEDCIQLTVRAASASYEYRIYG